MTAAESVALAGKMWLQEDDTRTYLATGTFPGWQDGADTLVGTNQLLLRNTAQCALRNFATWWMDLGGTGWFNDPRLWATMDQLKDLDQSMLQSPQAYRPEVAAVIDERSMLRVAAGGDALTRPAVYEVRRPLGRLGAPYGQYLLGDVIAERVRAKMFVFLNAWCLTAEEREALRAATRGALTVWCYAPGYHDGYKTSLDAMRQLTGFRLKCVTPQSATAEPTPRGRQLGLRHAVGVATPVAPLFAVTDAEADEILATYPDGSTAVALRQTDRGASLFVGPPGLSSELLRLAARQAHVHLFTDTECNVWANGPFVLLHAAHDGPVTLNTAGTDPIHDVLTGTVLGRGPNVTLTLLKGETRAFRIRASR